MTSVETLYTRSDYKYITHLSMVCPRIESAGATPQQFDIFSSFRVNFPTLGSPLRVKSLPLGIIVLE